MFKVNIVIYTKKYTLTISPFILTMYVNNMFNICKIYHDDVEFFCLQHL